MIRLRDFPAPSFRLFSLALALSLPVALGVLAPLFLGIAAAGAIALVATILVDLAGSVSANLLDVTREHEPRLHLGADNTIALAVENRDPRSVRLRLRDTPHWSFRSSSLFVEGKVAAGSTGTFSYITVPSIRGEFDFGNVTMRWQTPMGLFWLQKTFARSETVSVYPNLLDVHKYDVIARRGLLVDAGHRHTRIYGRGTEFESLRDYQPDDDYRRINWKATARRHQPISSLYETDRSQRMIVMLDLGRMMQTRIGDLTRLDLAINAALLLAYVALVRGDRVGLLGFADTIQVYLPARRGHGQFLQIVDHLHAIRAHNVESDYVAAFTRLRNDLHGRSLITLFTDLSDHETSRSVARQMEPLARHHLPLCVTLRDPALDSRSRQTPSTGRDVYEKVVASILVDERLTVLDELRRAGVETVDEAADHLTPETINRYLQIKARARL
jgi:uncharacterized protein (DUF58 family)